MPPSWTEPLLRVTTPEERVSGLQRLGEAPLVNDPEAKLKCFVRLVAARSAELERGDIVNICWLRGIGGVDELRMLGVSTDNGEVYVSLQQALPGRKQTVCRREKLKMI